MNKKKAFIVLVFIALVFAVSMHVILKEDKPVQNQNRLNANFEEKQQDPSLSQFLEDYDSKLKNDFSFRDVSEIEDFKKSKREELNNFIKNPLVFDKTGVYAVEERENDDILYSKKILVLIYKNEPIYGIPMYIMKPKYGKPPFPAIIGMHGHWNNYSLGKAEFLSSDMQSFKAEEFAKKGYIFFAFDSVLFGDREYTGSNEGDTVEAILQQKLNLIGYSLMEFVMQEDEIFLDYVYNNNEVDKNNIGCVGVSFGGIKCLWLSALNENIKTTVISSAIRDYDLFLEPYFGVKGGWINLIPGIANHIDTEGLLALISSRSLLITYGTQDPIFLYDNTQRIINETAKVYEMQGKINNLKSISFEGGHELPENVRKEALKFLDENLKGNISN